MESPARRFLSLPVLCHTCDMKLAGGFGREMCTRSRPLGLCTAAGTGGVGRGGGTSAVPAIGEKLERHLLRLTP